MKKIIIILLCVCLAVCCAEASENITYEPGLERAEERTRAFMELANENKPEAVYDYLIPELREMISREDFAANWAHERTYPYLITFWIFYREVTLEEDLMTGNALFARAARLPGQYENYGIVYVDGDYYFDAFRSIADGSYIAIFDRLK